LSFVILIIITLFPNQRNFFIICLEEVKQGNKMKEINLIIECYYENKEKNKDEQKT